MPGRVYRLTCPESRLVLGTVTCVARRRLLASRKTSSRIRFAAWQALTPARYGRSSFRDTHPIPLGPPMTRHLTRCAVLAAGAVALCLCGPDFARGQGGSVNWKQYRMEDVPSLPGDALSRMIDLRTGKMRVNGPNQKANQELFQKVATFYAQKVTHEQYYTYPETGELAAKIPYQTLDYLLNNELTPQLLVPGPTTQYSTDQADYIKEFGAALDHAIVDVLTKKNPPPIISVNAARMLSVAARSGAPAHAKTIIALLTNKFYTVDKKPIETPPHVLYWAIRAAESLLAAYDPVAFRLPGSPPNHSLPEADLVHLIQILEDLVLKGPNVAHRAASLESEKTIKFEQKPAPNDPKSAPGAPQAPPAPAPKTPALPANAGPAAGQLDAAILTPKQAALVRYFRKAAVRAMAKVRFDSFGGAAGVPLVRPGLTLARVAVNDIALSMPATTAEIGDAVVGLCGIQPTSALNQSEWLHAIATGIYLFAQVKSGAADDKSIPWRVYAARMQSGMEALNTAGQSNARVRGNRQLIQGMTGIITGSILNPIDKAGSGVAQINLDALTNWLQQNVPANRSLFSEPPLVTLSPRPVGG